MDKLVLEICRLVRSCGQILLEADREKMRVDAKAGVGNFVTEYDARVQEDLREGLKKLLPSAQFLGEEGDQRPGEPGDVCFIVDPIDGTMNFIKDYHMSAISVALVEKGCPSIGVVYNPYLDELFYAQRGCGAFCNGRPIRVSQLPLSQGIVVFGTSPYDEELSEKTFRLAYDYYKQALDVRRSGSAALDLCAVAAGRAELYFELKVSPWDCAAGCLLVQEAGGTVTTMEGAPISFVGPTSILARNQ